MKKYEIINFGNFHTSGLGLNSSALDGSLDSPRADSRASSGRFLHRASVFSLKFGNYEKSHFS